MKSIPFIKRHESSDLERILSEALQEEWLSAGRKYSRLCEEYLENKFGAGKAVITPNGFTALYLSMLLLDIKPGDEVLIASYSCPAALNSILLRGGSPVICEINDQGVVTAETLKAGLTEKTRAVVVNHYGGYACDLEQICLFCRENHLFLIEDAATAFGTVYKNKPIGSFGDMAVFSFNDKKDLPTGEGGALLIHRRDLWEKRAHRLTNGITRISGEDGKPHPVWVGAGFSNKVSELVCAALYAALTDADRILRKKQAICAQYRKELAGPAMEGKFRFPDISDQVPNGNTCYLLFPGKQVRDELQLYLKKHGVETLAHYGSLDCTADSDPAIRLTGSGEGREFDSRMLRLPVYTGLTEADVTYVCSIILGFYQNEGEHYGEYSFDTVM